jgi:signal transduction histidine kinase
MKPTTISPRRKGRLAIGLLVILGMAAAFAFNLKRGFDDELAHAAAGSQGTALAVAQHVASSLQKTDEVLNRLIDGFAPDEGEKWFGARKSAAFSPKLRLAQPEIQSLRIVRADGHVFYTLMNGSAGVSTLSLGDEAFFIAHRDNPALGLTLTGPSPGQAGDDGNLILSRRLDNPDGSFAGVAAATLGMSHIEGFFAAFNHGKNASLTLLNDKLAVLAHFPAGGRFRGKSLAGGQLAAHLRNNPRTGAYSGASPLDGVERISSFLRAGDFPLYLDAGLAKQDVLGAWRRNALIDGAVVFALSIAVLFLSIGGARRAAPVADAAEAPVLQESRQLTDSQETVSVEAAKETLVRQEDTPGADRQAPVPAEGSEEWLVRRNEILQQRLAEAQAKIESDRAQHLASIALLRKRADESLNQLKKAAEQRVLEEVERIVGQERETLRHARLAAMSEVIGNVAHLWRQPLNKLDLLLADIKVAQKFQELDPRLLLQSTLEGRQMIRDLSCTIDEFRNFFMPGKQAVAFNLVHELRDALEKLSASLREYGIETRLDAGEDVVAWGFPHEYSQVLLNILGNARDALLANAVTDGLIQIRVFRDGEHAHVVVRDNAGGIQETILGRLFEPDFATRRKGAGIGLFMSKIIMEDCMNGSIEARNIEGGAEFTVTCPLAKAS